MTPATEVVIREAFPTEVTSPAGVFREAMTVVTRTEVVILALVNGTIDEVFRHRYDPLDSALSDVDRLYAEPMVLATPDGPVTVNKAGGCGCSNPLKRYKPLPSAPRARQ